MAQCSDCSELYHAINSCISQIQEDIESNMHKWTCPYFQKANDEIGDNGNFIDR